jgi:hypothetical protein
LYLALGCSFLHDNSDLYEFMQEKCRIGDEDDDFLGQGTWAGDDDYRVPCLDTRVPLSAGDDNLGAENEGGDNSGAEKGSTARRRTTASSSQTATPKQSTKTEHGSNTDAKVFEHAELLKRAEALAKKRHRRLQEDLNNSHPCDAGFIPDEDPTCADNEEFRDPTFGLSCAELVGEEAPYLSCRGIRSGLFNMYLPRYDAAGFEGYMNDIVDDDYALKDSRDLMALPSNLRTRKRDLTFLESRIFDAAVVAHVIEAWIQLNCPVTCQICGRHDVNGAAFSGETCENEENFLTPGAYGEPDRAEEYSLDPEFLHLIENPCYDIAGSRLCFFSETFLADISPPGERPFETVYDFEKAAIGEYPLNVVTCEYFQSVIHLLGSVANPGDPSSSFLSWAATFREEGAFQTIGLPGRGDEEFMHLMETFVRKCPAAAGACPCHVTRAPQINPVVDDFHLLDHEQPNNYDTAGEFETSYRLRGRIWECFSANVLGQLQDPDPYCVLTFAMQLYYGYNHQLYGVSSLPGECIATALRCVEDLGGRIDTKAERYCTDNPDFRDEGGRLCSAWEGFNCSQMPESGGDSCDGYSEAGMEAVRSSCARTCQLCEETPSPDPFYTARCERAYERVLETGAEIALVVLIFRTEIALTVLIFHT